MTSIRQVSLARLGERNPIINSFLRMAVIPSPSIVAGHVQEDDMRQNMEKVRDLIKDLFVSIGIPQRNISNDRYGAQIIRVPGQGGYENRQPLMLMGHMDIVPSDEEHPTKPIFPTLIKHDSGSGNEDYIASDGTTTLGADDKASLAVIWSVVKKLKESGLPHAPLEIVIALDEETSNESMYKLDTSKLSSKYVVIADHFEEFNITTGNAGYVGINISVSGLHGGHSGLDIGKGHVNVNEILNELFTAIGTGVIKFHKDYPHVPLISKNINRQKTGDFPGGAIPTNGQMSLIVRSHSKAEETKEIRRIVREIKRIEEKYKKKEEGLKIDFTLAQDPIWNGKPNSSLVLLAKKSAIDVGCDEVKIEPMHGFSTANVIVQKKNKLGEKFVPILIGPTVELEHTTQEKVKVKSMFNVEEWLLNIITNYSRNNKMNWV